MSDYVILTKRVEELETQLAEKQREIEAERAERIRTWERLIKSEEWTDELNRQLEEKTKALQLAEEMVRAVKASVVDTVGGTDYEGNPTSEVNYLQRLRILVEKEDILEGGK